MSGDLEWLDEDAPTGPRDGEQLGRAPMRRRSRIALAALGVALLGGGIALGVTGPDDRPQRAQPTQPVRTVTLDPGNGAAMSGVATAPAAGRYGPPAGAIAAIRQAFPGTTLDSYVAVAAKHGDSRPTDFYNLSSDGRRIVVTVAPQRRTESDGVFRTDTSVEIAQQLGRATRVDVKVVRTPGPTTQRDFEAIQTLVQDGRLLALRGRGTMSR